jgi:predicted small secreted protein
MRFSSLSLIAKLAIVGIVISACSNTMEGVGKDLQTMGNSMGGSGNSSQQSNHFQTKGKDVVATPVKQIFGNY